MRKMKTAVIGCGMISHVYLNNMCTLFDILDVCAVCDLNEEAARKAAEKYGIPEVAADPETPLAGNNLLVGAIRLKNGAVAAVHFNGNAVHTDHNLIQIVGTKGSLSLGDPNTFWGHVELTTEEEANVNIPLKFSCGRNGDSRTDIYGFRGIGAAEMAWSICKERPARCSGDLAVHTVEVLEALNISANTGRTVELTTEFVPQKPFDIELTRKDPAEYGLHSKEELLLQ